jgi:hypothetical protein
MLDLMPFDTMKIFKRKTSGDFDDDSVEDQLMKLMQAYQRIKGSFTIHGIFEKDGFTPDSMKKLYQFVLNENF